MQFRRISFVLVIQFFVAFPATAHHAATAAFDLSQSLEIEGVVTRFAFKNPHVAIYLSVTDENGAEREWMATAPAVAPFRNWGWTADTIKEGQYLKLVGRKSRTNAPMILLERDDFESEKILELNPEDRSVVRVLGTENVVSRSTPELMALTFSDGRPNLSGTWASVGGGPPPRSSGQAAASSPTPPPRPSAGGGRNAAPLNDAGRALQATWDPAHDPAFVDCAERSVHRVLLDRHTIRLTQEEDQVVVELEGDGSRRIIPLNTSSSDATSHSAQGNSIASYDGETLVIETNKMLGGPSSQGGNILSDQMTMTERYRRADTEQGAGIEMTIILDDPTYLSATWQSVQNRVLTSDYQFAETECQLPLLSNSRE